MLGSGYVLLLHRAPPIPHPPRIKGDRYAYVSDNSIQRIISLWSGRSVVPPAPVPRNLTQRAAAVAVLHGLGIARPPPSSLREASAGAPLTVRFDFP